MRLDLAGTGKFDAVEYIASAQEWRWGKVEAIGLESPNPVYRSLLWAEPETQSAAKTARHLRRLALPHASLEIITSGPLHRYLPAWQCESQPAFQPLSPGAVGRLLSNSGWRVDQVISFHGPRAIAWNWLARLARILRQWDWEDKCTQRMWARYREAGWLWRLAPLALIRARAV